MIRFCQQLHWPRRQTLPSGPAFYGAAESKYDYWQKLNAHRLTPGLGGGGPITVSSQYGKPISSSSADIRLQLHFTF